MRQKARSLKHSKRPSRTDRCAMPCFVPQTIRSLRGGYELVRLWPWTYVRRLARFVELDRNAHLFGHRSVRARRRNAIDGECVCVCVCLLVLRRWATNAFATKPIVLIMLSVCMNQKCLVTGDDESSAYYFAFEAAPLTTC